MAKAEILKPFILSWEGGFVNHPNDKGGPTMRGITLKTFRSFYGQGKSVNDLKALTDAQWMYIFRKGYWDVCKADKIEDQSVANLIVDWRWGSGEFGTKRVQKCLGVKDDGIIGPITLAAINASDGSTLFATLWKDREKHFRECASKKGQSVFLNGWLNRLNSIKYGRLMLNAYKTRWGVRERKYITWDNDGNITENWTRV